MTDTHIPTGVARLAALPAADRRLLRRMAALALVALFLGILGGLLTALARAGFLDVIPSTGYRFLTVHGVSIFFYWLFMAQAALLLGFSATENGRGLVWRGLAWGGFALMLGGFVFSMVGAHMGTPLLYNGAPELGADDPGGLLVFNLGYLLLGLGLMVLPVSAIATLLERRWQGRQERLSAVGFALFAWAGFLVVTGFAALNTFLPGALWVLGMGPFPLSHGTRWHIVFHNMHYLPLMATVILWYVLVQALTGIKSVFGERFSKIVFSMYLVFVPPTSLYHMFLEPDLPGVIRVAGSLLSLFVSVPTLTAFLIIVASLEVHARTQGGRGLFGWMRLLPWRHPAMASVGVACLSMGLGITFAFVLIQERLAPLLSDTFFVPGYFHFFTVGTVSLTLLAALAVVLPALGGRPLWRPGLLRWMPWLAFAGLLVFGAAGVTAGYLGVPRRVMDVAYQSQAPALWKGLMAAVGVGGAGMALALTVFAAGVAASLWPGRESARVPEGLSVAWGGADVRAGASAWVGPFAVLVIVIAMYAFTVVGFELMQSLPVIASGSGAH
ncbi:MAG: cbb3-type cytochrome c oxidase subunit I [Rhodocyclales bacterium]|nr:cbb3-type cytochrome c oxidase subunit I [Rhodocyclales bacterium]